MTFILRVSKPVKLSLFCQILSLKINTDLAYHRFLKLFIKYFFLKFQINLVKIV